MCQTITSTLRGELTFRREFVDANNNDLLKNLGNLCQRVIKFCQAKMDGVIPEYDLAAFPALQQHKEDVNKLLREYIATLKAVKLRSGLSIIMRYVSCRYGQLPFSLGVC